MRPLFPFFAALSLLACGDNTLGVRTAAPTVNITSPADGAGFYEYEPITLVARVDDERTPLDELVYAWTANGDPLAGEVVVTGQDVVLSLGDGLPAGAFTLLLEVTDADGLAASDSVGVGVTQNLPPVVTLLLPAPGGRYELGDGVPVSAFVTDADAASNEEMSLTWGDAAEGAEGAPGYPNASGYADFELEGLGLGEHRVSVTVTDAGGDTDADTVDFEVVNGDEDGDGFDDDDCDDTDPLVYPGAEETCDGLDNDCDGEVDNDPVDPSSWYADADGDGHGATGLPLVACDAPEGHVDKGDDCDDADPAVFPGAEESDCTDPTDYNCDGSVGYADADGDGYAACEDCDDNDPTSSPSAVEYCDGIDNDCNGSTDDSAADLSSWYPDTDGDGYGAGTATLACDAAAGEVGNDDDCDDTDADFNPGATEEPCVATEDYDCDGSVATLDTDGDGETCDCDEGDPTVNSGATEACDGVDNDCDGTVDEAGATGESTFYADNDGDGYGDDAATATGCSAPAGHVATGGDCDDGDAAYNPGATEADCDDPEDYNCDGSVGYADADADGWPACLDCDDGEATTSPGATEACDGVDNDCDGDTDEAGATGESTFYADSDGDGYGGSTSTAACSAPSGHVASSTDCDDGEGSVNPGAVEACDDVDNDCDGSVDEGVASTFYADVDGDGYGGTTSTAACSAPSGYVANATDCDDGDDAVNPGAAEACDSVDNDCDGLVDDADPGVTGTTSWYADDDDDGYGDDGATVGACEAPAGHVALGGDCDDADAAYNPGATEADCADPADYNCDGATGYADNDGDGWAACEDCDDTDAAASPVATESCNGTDDDCDGEVDEDDASDASSWYADADGDGFGVDGSTTVACEQPSGHAAVGGDCDDGEARANPGEVEVCDGADTDEDCDGLADDASAAAATMTTYYADADGDGYGGTSSTATCSAPSGYVSNDDDCDDGDADTFPGAAASDSTTACMTDADGDGYGSDTVGTGVTGGTDCDDGLSAVRPGAAESCSTAYDDDCDGSTNDAGATACVTYYADADNDLYGTGSGSCLCSATTAYEVGNDDDCDDTDSGVNPAAAESCDGEDDDCDGNTDESVTTTYYADADGDGYGGTSSSAACSAPSGYVTTSTDCDDTDDDTFPGTAASDSTTACMTDADGDGYGSDTVASGVTAGSDCDDNLSAVRPGATESCSTAYDDDCDGSTNDAGATACVTYYADADNDLYGTGSGSCLCSATTAYEVSNDDDCDDTDSGVNPAATESCDGEDDDCDGTTDEGVTTTYYADADGDGYGGTSSSAACSAPSGYVTTSTDCDDTDDDTFPGAAASDSSTACMTDADGDGYGSDTVASGVTAGTDCDDNLSAVRPGGAESCSTAYDDDCDGSTNDAGATACVTYYADADNDLYGTGSGSCLCSATTAYEVSNDDDCDDTDSGVNPAAAESCDGEDDDCDGNTDEGVTTTYYADADGDGYGGTSSSAACSAPSGYVTTSTDCDDGDDDTFRGAAASDSSTACMTDADGDGYGSDTVGSGVTAGTDCDDADASVSPAATEVCDNGVDDDCDGGAGPCAPTSASLSTAVQYTGEARANFAGASVSAAGDVDGDGYDDILVGAYLRNATSVYEGAAYLVLGGAVPSDASLSTAVEYDGAYAYDYAGCSVAGAGDMDGDGHDDMLVGAYGHGHGATRTGAAFLVLGSDTPASVDLGSAVEYWGENAYDFAGSSVAGAGDVDGDGKDDMLVGASENDDAAAGAGAAYLVLGSASPASGSLSSAIQYAGEAYGDKAGCSVAGAGDVDGDSYDDFAVGAYGANGDAGATYLVLGGASPASADLSSSAVYSGERAGDLAGQSAAGAGDVDGDGYGDLLIGAYGHDGAGAYAGAAYLVLGSAVPASASLATAVEYTGENAEDSAGYSVSGAGDVDGDGHDEVLIGAYAQDGVGSYAGAAYLVLGSATPASASLSTAVRYSGAAASEYAGISVSGAGDVDADGYADILIGAEGNSDAASGAGAAYLLLGSGL